MWSSVPPVQSDSRILWSTVSLERTNSYPRFYAGRYWIKEGIMWDCQFFLGEARFVPQTIFLKEPQHPQKYQNLCWINLQNIWFSDVCRGYWVEFSRFSIITETHVCSKMFFFEKIFTYVGRIHTIPCLIIWGGGGGGGSHCTFWEKTPQVHWIIIREWPKNTTHHILRNLDNFPHGAFYLPPPTITHGRVMIDLFWKINTGQKSVFYNMLPRSYLNADVCLNLRGELYIFKENRVCSVRPRKM